MDKPPIQIEMTHEGKHYTGSYVIEGQWVTVSLNEGGSKRSHRGTMPDVALARLLLLELIIERKP